MIYITSLIPKHQTDEVLLGVSTSLVGAINVIKFALGKAITFKMVQTSPTRILLKNQEYEFFVMIRMHQRDAKGDSLCLITRRFPGKIYENLWIIKETYEQAMEYIQENTEDPEITRFDRCKITKVEGYTPFRRILGDEHPELNRETYFIYEMDIYRVDKEKKDMIRKMEEAENAICSREGS